MFYKMTLLSSNFYCCVRQNELTLLLPVFRLFLQFLELFNQVAHDRIRYMTEVHIYASVYMCAVFHCTLFEVNHRLAVSCYGLCFKIVKGRIKGNYRNVRINLILEMWLFIFNHILPPLLGRGLQAARTYRKLSVGPPRLNC